MTLSVASIVFFTTLVLGYVCKELKLCHKSNIPIQNFVIGIVSGILCYFTGVEANLLSAIILCVLASFSAGGLYDFSRTARRSRKISKK